MSSLSIRNMNHSDRYQRELEGKAAPMTPTDQYYSFIDAIQGSINMAKWEKSKGNMDGFWQFINRAYRYDAKLTLLKREMDWPWTLEDLASELDNHRPEVGL